MRGHAFLDALILQAGSVRVRLTVWYLAILCGTLLLFAGAVYLGVTSDLRSEMDSTLERVAGTVVEYPPTGGLGLDQDALPPGYAATLQDLSGQVLEFEGSLEPLAADKLNSVGTGQVWQSVTLGGGTWRVIAGPVRVAGSTVGILQVGMPEEPVERTVARLGLLLATLIPLALLVAGAGGLFLAGWVFQPIDRTTRTAAAIGAEDLTRRLPEHVVGTPGDLGRLAGTFNHMLDRLENSFQRQRQFTADASHELRAPLTLLLGQVDVALQRPRSDVEYSQALRGLREDILRLRRLVDGLLALARADAREDLLAPEPLDLGELVQQIADALEPQADERGIHLTTDCRPGMVICGDQARLMQLLLNLVENALNHTLEGGSVVVTAQPGSSPAMVCVAVRDTGCGIAPRHLPHVFERFYRADSARTSGGAGLGLAICRWIVEAHGGRIEVQSALNVGSTFTVHLPVGARRS